MAQKMAIFRQKNNNRKRVDLAENNYVWHFYTIAHPPKMNGFLDF